MRQERNIIQVISVGKLEVTAWTFRICFMIGYDRFLDWLHRSPWIIFGDLIFEFGESAFLDAIRCGDSPHKFVFSFLNEMVKHFGTATSLAHPRAAIFF